MAVMPYPFHWRCATCEVAWSTEHADDDRCWNCGECSGERILAVTADLISPKLRHRRPWWPNTGGQHAQAG